MDSITVKAFSTFKWWEKIISIFHKKYKKTIINGEYFVIIDEIGTVPLDDNYVIEELRDGVFNITLKNSMCSGSIDII